MTSGSAGLSSTLPLASGVKGTWAAGGVAGGVMATVSAFLGSPSGDTAGGTVAAAGGTGLSSARAVTEKAESIRPRNCAMGFIR